MLAEGWSTLNEGVDDKNLDIGGCWSSSERWEAAAPNVSPPAAPAMAPSWQRPAVAVHASWGPPLSAPESGAAALRHASSSLRMALRSSVDSCPSLTSSRTLSSSRRSARSSPACACCPVVVSTTLSTRCSLRPRRSSRGARRCSIATAERSSSESSNSLDAALARASSALSSRFCSCSIACRRRWSMSSLYFLYSSKVTHVFHKEPNHPLFCPASAVAAFACSPAGLRDAFCPPAIASPKASCNLVLTVLSIVLSTDSSSLFEISTNMPLIDSRMASLAGGSACGCVGGSAPRNVCPNHPSSILPFAALASSSVNTRLPPDSQTSAPPSRWMRTYL
mmetsp:Transcript_28980/g.73545  ORF Transcript_28980/g.73545 Transcript_28980/m.73545 type:complete len:337 (+) Transcript_28980:367-1377(+)